MKTVSVSEAKTRLGQLIDEVLDGHPVVVERGDRQVILKPFEQSDLAAEEAQFNAAFTPAPCEPRGAADKVRRMIRRVRRTA